MQISESAISKNHAFWSETYGLRDKSWWITWVRLREREICKWKRIESRKESSNKTWKCADEKKIKISPRYNFYLTFRYTTYAKMCFYSERISFFFRFSVKAIIMFVTIYNRSTKFPPPIKNMDYSSPERREGESC